MDLFDLSNFLKVCFDPKEREEVLVLCDYYKKDLGELFFKAFKEISDNVFFMVMKPTSKHGEEPSKIVAEALFNSDIFLAVTEYSITHTNARRVATEIGKSRGATLPGFTEDMFEALLVDPFEMRNLGSKVRDFLKKGSEVKVETPSGTNIFFEIERGRDILIDDGLYNEPGSFGNLPAGEVYLAPKEGSCEGVLVVDVCKHGTVEFVPRGTRIEIREGSAVNISSNCLLKRYFEEIKNARNIAEFGIGINRNARVIGNILQDEKSYGTCHIAFGDNKSFGGKVESEIHIDVILLNPTIYVDGELLMKNGNLVI